MKSAAPPLLAEQYLAALEDYLRGSGEAALSRAYDLGREALSTGMGVLEMAMMHRHAVGAASQGSLAPHEFARAAEFFAESLAPFEASPMWLPDSTRFVFFAENKAYISDIKTKRVREIFASKDGRLRSVDVSPDGTLLYFTVYSSESDIWLLDLQ